MNRLAAMALLCLAATLPPVPRWPQRPDSRRGAEKLMVFPKAKAVIGPAPVTFTMRAVAPPQPASVTLAWDASNTTNTVDGYYVLTGSSPTLYTNRLDAGNNLTLTVTGLSGGGNYFFVAQAYNSVTNSGFSNVVEYNAPPVTVLTVPILSSPSISGPWTDTGTALKITNASPPLYFKLGISAGP